MRGVFPTNLASRSCGDQRGKAVIPRGDPALKPHGSRSYSPRRWATSEGEGPCGKGGLSRPSELSRLGGPFGPGGALCLAAKSLQECLSGADEMLGNKKRKPLTEPTCPREKEKASRTGPGRHFRKGIRSLGVPRNLEIHRF